MLGHYVPLACVRYERGKERKMKVRTVLWGVVALSLTLSPSAHAGEQRDSRIVALCTGAKLYGVTVKFHSGVAADERAAIYGSHRQQLGRIIPQLNLHAGRALGGKTAEDVMNRYKPLVELVEMGILTTHEKNGVSEETKEVLLGERRR